MALIKTKIPLYLPVILLLSLGGLMNGYDTGSIGAVTSMKSFEESIGALSPFLLGFTVSLIMLTGFIPCFFAGYLSDRWGRLRAVSLGAGLFTLGSVLQAAANSLGLFLAGRAFAGFGEGIYLGAMNVYVCEIAPSRRRGTLANIPQLITTMGVCVGYFTCYGSVRLASSMSWRLPFVVQGIVGATLATSCFFLPDSPRWLMLHGKRNQALKSIQRLDFSPVEAEELIRAPETSNVVALGPYDSFRLCFRRPYRYRTTLALFVLGMVQLSGIDGVLYYAPTLFAQAGLSSETSTFLASGLSSILMLLITIPALLFFDKFGRRTMAIYGGVALSSIMFLIGCLYASNSVHSDGPARWVVIVSVFLFSLVFCAWAVCGKVYASEIQPTNTRAAANTLAQGLSFLTNWFVAIITPILLDKSAFGAYFLFGGLALFTVIVLAYMMPETKGKSLESIQEAFTSFQKPGTRFLSTAARVARRFVGMFSHSTTRTSSLSSLSDRADLDSARMSGEGIELTTMTIRPLAEEEDSSSVALKTA